ncbi:hypothetical protein Tco_0793503 [Tanacetum coccineum]
MAKENMSNEEIRHVQHCEVRKKEQAYEEEKYSAAHRYMLFIHFVDEDDYIPLGDIIARKSTSKAITPDLPIEEPDNSLNIGDEHLDTILATESDEVIKSSVENLVLIPSEFEGMSDDTSDVPTCDNNCVNVESDFVESLINRDTLILQGGDGVEQEEKEFDLRDILQIQDVILRERLLKISRLITNIESLKDNPTPDYVLNSPSLFLIPVVDSDSFLEEFDTSLSHLDNSLPEFETSSDHTEETRTLIRRGDSNDNSMISFFGNTEFESFHFDPSFPRPPPEPPDVKICLYFEPDALVIDNFNELNDDQRGRVKIRSLTPTSPLRAGGFHRDGTFMDYPDLKPCAPWLCPFSDASYPQLHLGNPIS